MLTIDWQKGLCWVSDSGNVPRYALVPSLIWLLGGTDDQVVLRHNHPNIQILWKCSLKLDKIVCEFKTLSVPILWLWVNKCNASKNKDTFLKFTIQEIHKLEDKNFEII